MTRIITNTAGNTRTKFYLNGQSVDFTKVIEAGSVNVKEPDFADLHALYEIEYEKFITDTSVEIKKRTQKLLELESIVFRKLSPDGEDG